MNVLFHWPKADTRWYFGVHCRKCRTPILFARDRTEGAEEGTQPLPEKLVLTCTHEKCGHRADYTAAAMSRFQRAVPETEKPARNNENSKKRKPKS